MKAFMDKDFLLSTETAQELYHNFAAQVPVLDYHCHINPQEIAEDRKFENITQVWLWRPLQMASDAFQWCGRILYHRRRTGQRKIPEMGGNFGKSYRKSVVSLE